MTELASGKTRGSVALALGASAIGRDAGPNTSSGAGEGPSSFDLSRQREGPNLSARKRHRDCPVAYADFDLLAAHLQQLRPPWDERELLTAFDHREALHRQVDGADMSAGHAHAFDG